MPDLSYENNARALGYKMVCGIDEAGRGPLAGPVCAAAVILPEDCIIEGLDDSKKLTEKMREALFPVIIEKALAYSICFGSVEDIETKNILATTMDTMAEAFNTLPIKADFALIDGNCTPKGIPNSQTIVKGDSKSLSVAAASILAKVSRDRLMLQMDEKYPEYDFKKHKGYGTKVHMEAIRKYGPCEIHRLSFLKGILNG